MFVTIDDESSFGSDYYQYFVNPTILDETESLAEYFIILGKDL